MAAPRLVPLNRPKIIGESPVLRKCLEDAGRAPSSDASVIVTVETGTGNELFSKAVHEKGAFTGAASKQRGLIEQADGGNKEIHVDIRHRCFIPKSLSAAESDKSHCYA